MSIPRYDIEACDASEYCYLCIDLDSNGDWYKREDADARIDKLEAAIREAIELLTKGYDSLGIIAHGLSTALEDTA